VNALILAVPCGATILLQLQRKHWLMTHCKHFACVCCCNDLDESFTILLCLEHIFDFSIMQKAIIASLAVVAAGADLREAHPSKKIVNSYIVRLADTFDREGLKSHVAEMRKNLPGDFEPFHVYENMADHSKAAYAVKLTARGLERMLQNDHVKFIEEDQTVSLNDCVSQSGADWGTNRINHRDYNSSKTYTYDYTTGASGVNVDAYVIDTGIYCENDDFTSKKTGSCTFGFSSVTNVIGVPDETDGNGHGTHCAGTIAGQTFGAAKEANLIAVKVLSDRGSGSTTGVIDGINWVAGRPAVTGRKSIANLSLGGGFSQVQNDAVASATAAGVTMVVAAGNDNSDACGYSPASEPSAITVAASDINNARASYSNYGDCVDIFGPGSAITSAWIGSPSATNTISGTSMASPQVCGTGAKFLSADSSLTPATLTAKILADASANEISDVKGSPNLMAYGYCS
jgi:serine protease